MEDLCGMYPTDLCSIDRTGRDLDHLDPIHMVMICYAGFVVQIREVCVVQIGQITN